MSTDVFAPSAMAVKISKSIRAFREEVCWKGESVLEVCCGVGRLVTVGVAMNELSCPEMWTPKIIYADALKTFLFAASQLPECRPAGILSVPRNGQKAIDETRISPLVRTPARHGVGRRRVRPLGPAAAGIPHPCRRRGGARGPEHGRRTRGFHRSWKRQTLHRKFAQRGGLLKQKTAPASPQP